MGGRDTSFTFFQKKSTPLYSQQVQQVFGHQKAIHLLPKCPKIVGKSIYNLTIYSHFYFLSRGFLLIKARNVFRLSRAIFLKHRLGSVLSQSQLRAHHLANGPHLSIPRLFTLRTTERAARRSAFSLWTDYEQTKVWQNILKLSPHAAKDFPTTEDPHRLWLSDKQHMPRGD